MIKICINIKGKVQGVWFRGWTQDEAQKLELSGWVRNLRDGSVEALFVGNEEQVNQMVALCYQGPRMAMVDSIEKKEITEQTPAFKEGEFLVLR